MNAVGQQQQTGQEQETLPQETGQQTLADLAELTAVDEAQLDHLRTALARRAEAEGTLELAYRSVTSPVGDLLLVATSRGLVRVAYDCEDHERVLQTLAGQLSPRILRAPARLDEAAGQLDDYFAGRRVDFTLPLDRGLSRGFRLEVLLRLPEIGYGRTMSYTEVAAAAGNPKAVRAVGSACATNPLPVVVPCHRVLRSDGSLGGYIGGLGAKQQLLALERGGAPRPPAVSG